MKNDPKEIIAKFNSKCAETGKVIRKGELCVYYPLAKKVYSVDSKTAYDYRNWKADLSREYDYWF